MELILASHNPHKAVEMARMLAPLGITCQPCPKAITWEESGTTFAENSAIKAQAVFQILQAPVIADDSGLCVPALDDQPGVYSARYAGEGATDKQNRTKLLTAMANLNDAQRQAYFVCTITYIDASGAKNQFTGQVSGHIAQSEQGQDGFGYDSIFVPEGYQDSFAQLNKDVKDAISHRGRALVALLDYFKFKRR